MTAVLSSDTEQLLTELGTDCTDGEDKNLTVHVRASLRPINCQPL